MQIIGSNGIGKISLLWSFSTYSSNIWLWKCIFLPATLVQCRRCAKLRPAENELNWKRGDAEWKKRHFGRSKLHFLYPVLYTQREQLTRTKQQQQHRRRSQRRKKKIKQKWQMEKVYILYAMKKIKFSVQSLFFFTVSLFFFLSSLRSIFALFNINYMLCVVPRCAIYLDVVALFFLYCHFSHLIFIFIRCDCIICPCGFLCQFISDIWL